MSGHERTSPADVGAGQWPSAASAALSRAISAFSRWPVIGHVLQGVVVFIVWTTAIQIGLRLGWYPLDVGNYIALGGIVGLAVAVCRVLPVTGLVVVGILTAWPAWAFEVHELRIIPLVLAAFLSTAGGARLRVAAPITAVFVVAVNIPSWAWSDAYSFDSLISYLQYVGDPSTRILAAVVVAGALLLGYAVRVQRSSVETLRDRNAELERLRDADMARIAAEERTAVARDIHDIVAHHVSAMVIRAQAADRVADSRPEAPRDAVRWIANDGQEALSAMRQVVRVLRGDSDAPAPLAPTDFASELDGLVRRVRGTGLDIDESIEPGLDLSTMLQSTVVRILQEALTNVMLHSDASTVHVSLAMRNGELELRVDDDGSDRPQPVLAARGGGSGIRGMRERAETAGGSLVSGRLNGSGWTILARLPAGRTAN